MKHMNVINAGIQSNAVALEQDSVAMEGLGEMLKDGWNALAAKFSPTDHEALMKRLSYLPKMRESLIDVKRQISNGDDNGQFSKDIKRFTQHMPVSADTGEQLVKELALYRKRIQALVIAAENAKTPEQVKQYRQQMLVELSKKGNVSKDIIFTKRVVLQVLDETIALLEVVQSAGGFYAKSHQKAKTTGAALECYTDNMALESYHDVFEIALEDAVDIIVGTLMLFAAVVVRVMMYFFYLMCVCAFLSGGFAASVGLFFVGLGMQWLSQSAIDKSTEKIFEE